MLYCGIDCLCVFPRFWHCARDDLPIESCQFSPPGILANSYRKVPHRQDPANHGGGLNGRRRLITGRWSVVCKAGAAELPAVTQTGCPDAEGPKLWEFAVAVRALRAVRAVRAESELLPIADPLAWSPERDISTFSA